VSEQTPDAPEERRPFRLDPDRAASTPGAPEPSPPKPVIDTRPYRWAVGIFGLALLIAFSVYMFTTRGIQTAGIPPGKPLHYFVAPLATSGLNGGANMTPRCDPAHPNLQALNVCGRKPLVLGLFVTGSGDCEKEIDTLQTVSREFSPSEVQFAAVAVQASQRATAALVRSHHWTIPVAYDVNNSVGYVYDVEICPMVELAYRGGIVADRLIGDHWLSPGAVAARVRAMLSSQQ
jgi:AhpC/TSA family